MSRVHDNHDTITDDYSVKTLAEDIIQESLKGGRSIGQTERHDKVFEMTIASAKCRFPFVATGDTYEIVSAFKVQFSEDASVTQAVQSFGNQG